MPRFAQLQLSILALLFGIETTFGGGQDVQQKVSALHADRRGNYSLSGSVYGVTNMHRNKRSKGILFSR